MKWRILALDAYDAAMNMAIDHAIFEEVVAGRSPPTIRFYQWKQGAVSIGNFQKADIVKQETCQQMNVAYVRRPTGGNLVYHAPSDLTYAVIAPRSLFGNNPEDTMVHREAYKTICGWIIDALRHVEVFATLYGSNDIVVNNKKIVGNAQKLTKDALLQHGAIFINADKAAWAKYSTIPLEKFERIASVPMNKDRLYNALLYTFTHNDIVTDFSVDGLTLQEFARARAHTEETYTHEQFIGTGKEHKGDACIVDIIDD